MKNFITFAAVGLAGYLIGYYQTRYETLKFLVQECIINGENNKSTNEESKEES